MGRASCFFRADVAQWDGLHGELQAIAGNGASQRDGQAVQNGMFEETGRRFYPEALSLVTGGFFSVVGAAARTPVRITPDILDDAGRFLGQRNAGENTPRFATWLSKPGNVVEIMPGGQVRFSTTINDPASSLNGRTVSVSYANGFPDFTPFTNHPSGVKSVAITMTGTNRVDFRLANIAAGHPEWGNRRLPAGRGITRRMARQWSLCRQALTIHSITWVERRSSGGGHENTVGHAKPTHPVGGSEPFRN